MPETVNPSERGLIVPAEDLPSPQSIVAEKSEGTALWLPSVNTASWSVDRFPAIALTDVAAAVSGASWTWTWKGQCYACRSRHRK